MKQGELVNVNYYHQHSTDLAGLTVGKVYVANPNSGLDFIDDDGNCRLWEAFDWKPVATVKFKEATSAFCGSKVSEVITDGLKHDSGKVLMGLLHNGTPNALRGAAEVLTFGAAKYAAHSWRMVKAERYLDAFYRHMSAMHNGEVTDPDSGLPHIHHAVTNLLFISELMYGGDNPFGVPDGE